MALVVQKAYVEWRAVAVGQDGSDGDTDPDQIPLAGVRVRLTPSPRKVEVAAAGSEPARTVTLREWELITDATGKLINPDSPDDPIAIVASDAFPGVAVEWTSTISAPDSGVPDIAKRWAAPTGTTVDLSTVASIPPAPSPLPDYLAAVAEARSARDVSIAAADRAETAQHWAETARTGAEAARDTATGAASTATGAASTATTQAGLAATARTGAETAAALVSGRAYWGPHRPDILARFGTSPEEVAAKAWINAATSGAVYNSTTGPEGAWVWRKRGSVWVCVEGDTGEISLLSALRFGWTATALTLRRAGHLVTITADALSASAATSDTIAMNIPSGLGAANRRFFTTQADAAATLRRLLLNATAIATLTGRAAYTGPVYGSATLPCSDTAVWPTSLTVPPAS